MKTQSARGSTAPCWNFPRDPHFQVKAGRILDLYARCWQEQPLRDDEFVISTEGKTSIQARLRIHPSSSTRPGESMRVEHEYARGGAWAHLAALDVHRAKVFGHGKATTGIAPFKRLVNQIMSQSPYNTARRMFWIMDNGSSHRCDASRKPVRDWFRFTARCTPVGSTKGKKPRFVSVWQSMGGCASSLPTTRRSNLSMHDAGMKVAIIAAVG